MFNCWQQVSELSHVNMPVMFMFNCWQVSELSHVNMPVMLMPDDFKAYCKTRVDNHMFNK